MPGHDYRPQRPGGRSGLSYLGAFVPRQPRAGEATKLIAQVQEVKYRLSDGTEIHARLVLKDEDLDLAFLALLKPAEKATEAKMAFVPISERRPATADARFDDPDQPHRRGLELHCHAEPRPDPCARLTPRTCYISSSGGLGVPVFNHQGKMLGMISPREAGGERREHRPL